MTRDDFNNLFNRTVSEIRLLNKQKGQDYAGQEDALRNFKEVAARSGQHPHHVWFTYFTKHLMAIESYIKHGQVESEPIEERIKDAILYLHLLMGLIKEDAEKP